MHGESTLLAACYRESLMLAHRKGLRSIAFPLISAGSYGYPRQEAMQVATAAIRSFLRDCPEMTVYLTVFDKESFRISEELYDRVEQFIDQHYVDVHRDRRRYNYETAAWQSLDADMNVMPDISAPLPNMASGESSAANVRLDDLLANLDEGFRDMLLRLIDERGMTDPECYTRANVDKKVFSKIKTNKAYTPKKTTVMAFAIALQLDMNGTRDLLSRAGYGMSHASKFDVIMEYFITSKCYDVDRINQVLYDYDMPLLGSSVA